MRHIYYMPKKVQFRSQELSNVSTYQNEIKLLVFDGAKAYASAHLSRKLPTSIGALIVDGAKTCLRMQKIAIAVWPLREHEKLGSLAI